ncbi:MAG: hypothetical protein QOF21_544 [Actinomycetota bacterium]
MALPVLDRLALVDGESVLDAGCGSGRVTRHVVERNPTGTVVAVDADADMVRVAADALADTHAVVRQVDLLELDLPALDVGVDAVDAIFSTATFHWIKDHDTLFARLFAALNPDGRIEAQCGGGENTKRVKAVARAVAQEASYRETLADFNDVTSYYGPEETHARLDRAGFIDVRCWLQEIDVVPDDPVAYMSTIVLGQHRERLGEKLGLQYVREVADRLGSPVTLDYVRLNISARRPA